mmetsp:Transcript_113011/g.364892  ORF Transcript_113011/g.364892 Transcript_113011/m.364892 type:complete len:221 (+) Transcript_113011:210-872(+)
MSLGSKATHNGPDIRGPRQLLHEFTQGTQYPGPSRSVRCNIGRTVVAVKDIRDGRNLPHLRALFAKWAALPLGVQVKVHDTPALKPILPPHGADCIALAASVVLWTLWAELWERVDPIEQAPYRCSLPLAPAALPWQRRAELQCGGDRDDVLAQLVEQHDSYEVPRGALEEVLTSARAMEATPEVPQAITAKLNTCMEACSTDCSSSCATLTCNVVALQE